MRNRFQKSAHAPETGPDLTARAPQTDQDCHLHAEGLDQTPESYKLNLTAENQRNKILGWNYRVKVWPTVHEARDSIQEWGLEGQQY